MTSTTQWTEGRQKRAVGSVARDLKRLMDRKAWGIGDAGFHAYLYAWEYLADYYDEWENFDPITYDDWNMAEKKRLEAEAPELYKTWQAITREAKELAATMDEYGL